MMGLPLFPMFPPPGSPKWMYDKYAQEMQKMVQRSMRLRIAMLIITALALAVLIFCVYIGWTR